MGETRKFWGWGVEERSIPFEAQEKIGQAVVERFGTDARTPRRPPRVEDLDLRPPRIQAPSALESIVSAAPFDRAGHTYGKSFRDVVRGIEGDFSKAPDVVAFPASEEDVVRVLEWCDGEHCIAVPYGGGSSVCGGVEAPESDRPVVSIDLGRLDRIVEIDQTSRAARIQGGIYGPALEEGLRPEGLTLRHFPQSFEFSTLGGWIATRSGGHYATLYTHIDDFVESLRIVTPTGTLESRRLPGSGAGPSPDRMFVGSEGILGIITEAWMRLQDRPTFRASASVKFDSFLSGARAVRAISQSGLFPSNCRLLDPGEAAGAGAAPGDESVLILGFESADHPLDAWIARTVECARDHGGRIDDADVRITSSSEGAREGAAGAWRKSFIEAPYLRDVMVALGMITDTFETAVTWDQFPTFHENVTAAVRDAVAKIGLAGDSQVNCRFTHVYPDGPAPYYTVIAPSAPGRQLEDWDAVKAVAMDAVAKHGGTVTHHHAVGRDHRPGYDRQRPDLFARALRAAKRELDPNAILNPGVLIDP